MQKDCKAYLHHIYDSIVLIEKYVKGMAINGFARDRKTVDAVIRNFEIIGEASSKTSKEFREEYPELPWKDMIGMRNILIHNYLGVDVQKVWRTVKKDLPLLKKQLRSILSIK